MPLVGHAVRHAIESGCVDHVVVSTDSDEIAEAAVSYGADVPFRRPMELSNDSASTIDVVIHAMNCLVDNRSAPRGHVICLQPTSPLRTPDDVSAAYKDLCERKAECLVSVSPAPFPLEWVRHLHPDGTLREAQPGRPTQRRQETEPEFVLNGAIYLADWPGLEAVGTWHTSGTVAYVMPLERSIDIDTEWDLRLARAVWADSHRGQ
jgi:CMP-N,N'-diacetyllegionaminic acid synthase